MVVLDCRLELLLPQQAAIRTPQRQNRFGRPLPQQLATELRLQSPVIGLELHA